MEGSLEKISQGSTIDATWGVPKKLSFRAGSSQAMVRMDGLGVKEILLP